MGKRTPFYEQHVASQAKIVDFAGWDMPLHYGSQLAEHHEVRRDAGMFDVSHMTIVDLKGAQVRPFLLHLLANSVDRLKQKGKALYSCMLNEQGGVIDDVIVYYCDDTWFRIVWNAATRMKDFEWVQRQAESFKVEVRMREDLAMLAVQGPNARDKVHRVLTGAEQEAASQLAPFNSVSINKFFIARTGYTGEDGYEIMLPATAAARLWAGLLQAGVKPIGLGARDTLRLEAGMNLYGTDMDDSTTPLESGLAWTIAWEPSNRDFIGRAALEKQRAAGVPRELVGLLLVDKGVLRNHLPVIVNGRPAGEITSGSFSPTLNRSIALARVPSGTTGTCQVDVRGKLLTAKIVKPPFVRHGKACISVES